MMEGSTLTPSANLPQRKNYHGYQQQMGQHWMTPEISAQLQVCNQLRKTSEATNKPVDHEAYQAQCRKVHGMMEESKSGLGLGHLPALPPQYGYGWHQQNEQGYNGYQPMGPRGNSNFQHPSGNHFQGNNRKPITCGPCNRTFYSKQKLDEHLKDHVDCPFPECKLNAHIKVIDQHINNQHMLVNFASLQIDDEAWIAERKKRFPSIQRAELRRAEQIEKLKRGEKLGITKKPFKSKIKSITSTNKDGTQEENTKGDSSATAGGKGEQVQNESGKEEGKRKGPFKRRRQEREMFSGPPQPVIKVDLLDSDDETRDGLQAFKGTKCFYEELGEVSYFGSKSVKVDEDDLAKQEENIVISDDEDWQGEDNEAEAAKGPLVLGGALGSLMGAYSDSEDESADEAGTSQEKDTPQSVQKIDDDASSKDKTNTSSEVAANQNKSEDVVRNQAMLVDVAKQETINAGVKQDTEQNKESTSRVRNRRTQRKKVLKGPPKPRRMPRRRKTLLEKLLQADIIHERNIILQCVRFVLQNDFFDGINNVSSKKKNDSSEAEKQTKECIINDNKKEDNNTHMEDTPLQKDTHKEKHIASTNLGHQITSQNSKITNDIKDAYDSNKAAARKLKKQLLEDDVSCSNNASKRKKSDTREIVSGEEMIDDEIDVKKRKLSEEENSVGVCNKDTMNNAEKNYENKGSEVIGTDGEKKETEVSETDGEKKVSEVGESDGEKKESEVTESDGDKKEREVIETNDKKESEIPETDGHVKESGSIETDGKSDDLKEDVEIVNHEEQKMVEV